MPTFTATERSGVVDFLAASFRSDPRLAFRETRGGTVICLYRALDGARCGFGRCVTDEELAAARGDHPERWYEGLAASEVIAELRNYADYWKIGDGQRFWDSLQTIHDAVATERLGDGVLVATLLERWRDKDYPVLENTQDVLLVLVEPSAD